MKVYIGIDWSECKHDLTFLNEHGQLLLYITVAHTETGLLEMERARQKLNVAVEECVIGLETAHTQGKSPRWTKCCPICCIRLDALHLGGELTHISWVSKKPIPLPRSPLKTERSDVPNTK